MARRRRRNPSTTAVVMSFGAVAALAVVGFMLWRKKQQEAHLFDAVPLPGAQPPGDVPTTTVTPAKAAKILQAGGVKIAAPVR